MFFVLTIGILLGVLFFGIADKAASGLAISTRRSFLPLILKQPTPTPTKTKTPTPTNTPQPTPTAVIPTPVGPIGGTFTSLAVDPNQDDYIYAGHFQSGVYKSFDQGQSWYRKSSGLGTLSIQSLAAHPSSSSIVYAGTYNGGIYKSTNAGESWFAINGGVVGNHIIYDIEVDYNNPNTLYIATRVTGSNVGYIFKSTNAGSSWQQILKGDVFASPDYFYDIDLNTLNSSELYLTTHEHGFYKSINAGASFYPINNGVADTSARTFALDPSYNGLVYAGVWHGASIYRTWNGGASWTNNRSGLPTGAKVLTTYLDPFGRTQKRVFAGTYGNGLYTSDDFAQNWSSRGLAGQRIYDLFVTGGSPSRWYVATEDNGIFRSTNYGASWISVMGQLSLNPISAFVEYPPRGLQLAAVFGKGIYQVNPNGSDWQEFEPQLEDKTILDLQAAGTKLYALTENAIYELSDSNWLKVGLPMASTKLDVGWLQVYGEQIGQSLEMAQNRFETNAKISTDDGMAASVLAGKIRLIEENLYLLTHGNGLYLRINDGWEAMGFKGHAVLDLERNPFDGLLYASVCDLNQDCQLISYDRINWQVQTGMLDGIRINDLRNSGFGFLAATDAGIYLWDPLNEDWVLKSTKRRVLTVTQNEKTCSLAAGGVGEYFLSQDCGNTWSAFTGEETWNYQSLIFPQAADERLLLGSKEAGASIVIIP